MRLRGPSHPRSRRLTSARAGAVVLATALAGCSFDWDALDPALGGAGPTSACATTGTPTGTGGGTTSAGGSTGTGAAGGSVGGGGAGGAGGQEPWFDLDFTRRRPLSFAAVGEDLQDFPAMVRLDGTRIDYGAVQGGGQDLRFVAADQATVLDHEIEVFAPGGDSYLWVEVPFLPAGGAADFIWMYYGNPQASDGQDAAGTWSNSYLAVWHLHADLADSTSNGNDGMAGGSVNAAGVAGDGEQFDGVNDYVQIGSPASLANVFIGGATLSAWIEPAGWGGIGFGRIVDKSMTNFAENGWGWQLDSGSMGPTHTLRFERRFDGGLGRWETATDTIVLHVGQHVALTYAEDSAANEPAMYINGQYQANAGATQPTGLPQADAASPLRIGNEGSDIQRSFDGVIDEVRIASVIRSGYWIAAQHQSLADTLITYGPEQLAP